MEDFSGWNMQYAADPCLPSRPSDDDSFLGAFVGCGGGGGFDLRSDHGGFSNLPSSHTVQNLMPCCHGGASLSVSDGFMGLDTADMLASVTGALDDGGLLDTFAYGSDDVVAEEPAQPTASNAAFSSGYSSTTGGNYGNISSGESNTCVGGHDTEVASSPCGLSRSALPQATAAVPASKRKLGKYPAIAATTTSTEAQVAAPRRGAKRDSATSSSSTSIAFAAEHGDHHAAGGSSSSAGGGHEYEPDSEATIAQVKEMIYRAAAMRPVHQLVCGVGSEAAPSSQTQSKPRRKNVRISSDPQTVAARLRRERVSERLRVLQRLVPGGSRMDTASMLDEAASYLKFLKSQVKALEKKNPSNGGYHNGSLLPQSYTGSLGVGGGGTGVAFGRDGAIGGGHVNSNSNMHL